MLYGLLALSALTFFTSIGLILYLPVDYFILESEKLAKLLGKQGYTKRGLRNFCGVLIISAGMVMLITPGQGVLIIVIGAIMCDIPGKRALLHKFIRKNYRF